jgi:alanine racemase
MPKRPCWVEISTDSLEDNYRTLTKSLSDDSASRVELLAIVKADAYGHGLRICAPAAVRAGARWLGVTSVEEGVAAREVCPEAEILVIGGPFAGQGAAVVGHSLTAVVWEGWQLKLLKASARAAGCAVASVPVHLEVDTGMSRQGAGAEELDAILGWFGPESRLRLAGLMTHLYAADESDGRVTQEQFAKLSGMVERVFARGHRPEWLHVGNSAAVMSGEPLRALREIAERFGMRSMARPGLALYGLAPEFTPEEPEAVRELRGPLRRVLAWKTRVVSVRSIEAGAAVGYNGTFVATEPMRVALLAVGYADGLRRELGNRGWVLVAGCRAPIVGRISMDQTVVDVTEIPSVVPGDEVVLLGRQGDECVSAEDHARWAGTISWEIFTGIGARVERLQRTDTAAIPLVDLS